MQRLKSSFGGDQQNVTIDRGWTLAQMILARVHGVHRSKAPPMSALTRFADSGRTSREVREVPILFSNSGFRCQALRDHPLPGPLFSPR
jgi:hypothetical protein